MFGWLRKKDPTPAPFANKSGLFTTHDALMRTGESQADAMLRFEAQTFQIPMQKMQVLAPAPGGGQMQIAMDEAYPDLQLAKIQNSLGGFLPFSQVGYFASYGFIGYQSCALISQHWLVEKACKMPAIDAMRHGYEITTDDGDEIDPDVLSALRKADKAFNIKNACMEFVSMGRIFGIRVALFEVESNDPKYYEKPFNIDGVRPGSYKGISQIDPYWITPELDGNSASNPASRHFYEPTWWRINGVRVHRSHLIIMRNGGDLPDILKPTYFYGGIPVPQKIAERVYAAERTANEAPMLAMSKRLTVLNVDISQAVASGPTFQQKMQEWTEIQNNYGVKVVGEAEQISQFDTSLSDLDAVIMTQYQIVAAVAEVPATKLLGTSPKGFGASGEYEESSYHEFLESLQETYLTPFIERHHMLLMKSYIGPKFGATFNTAITWKPTDTPTAKEVAEINLLKAQTDNQLVQSGAIDGTDARLRIVKEDDSGYNGVPEMVPGGPGDRVAQQEAEAALEQPVEANNKEKSAGDALEKEFEAALRVLEQ